MRRIEMLEKQRDDNLGENDGTESELDKDDPEVSDAWSEEEEAAMQGLTIEQWREIEYLNSLTPEELQYLLTLDDEEMDGYTHDVEPALTGSWLDTLD